jgi:hypothetical protein
MEWQNNRPAPRPNAVLVNVSRMACALTTLALSALLLGCLAASPMATVASAQEQRFEGQWLVEYKTDEGKPVLTLRYRESRQDAGGGKHESSWDTSRSIESDKLSGLTREQAFSTSGTNVRFDVRRDAGTFACEGWFKQGSGSGHFTFIPNPGFAAELGRRGIGSPDARQLFSLARADVGLALLDELKTQGYERPTLEQLVRMGDHGVHFDYVRSMKEMGYSLRTIDALVRMRDHGVTPDFIRELRDFGYRDLSAEELLTARDHGVSSSFIRELQTAGYQAPPLEGLVRIRDHGVSADYITGLREEGYGSLTLEQLVHLRDHGVTLDFIRRAKSRGGNAPTVDELINMRDRGSY